MVQNSSFVVDITPGAKTAGLALVLIMFACDSAVGVVWLNAKNLVQLTKVKPNTRRLDNCEINCMSLFLLYDWPKQINRHYALQQYLLKRMERSDEHGIYH
jgi:hypothetical protein